MNETAKGNRDRAQTRESLSTKLNRLSETARRDPAFQFENIAHLVDVELLEWSFRQLRRDAAAGVDGVTSEDFEKNLRVNLADLHGRLREGRYRAQPLKRMYIEKEDGKKRPLSIPALEDKIAQRAAAELLTRIYEKDFLACSYGYRPGRGPHDALEAIQGDITFGKANYVLDADISDYFGSIVRSELMTMIQKRIKDKHLLALVGKWLHSDDWVNPDDTLGSQSFNLIGDWTSFSNPFRNWGNDGAAFPSFDNRGHCVLGSTCRIWDWRLAASDRTLLNRSISGLSTNPPLRNLNSAPSKGIKWPRILSLALT